MKNLEASEALKRNTLNALSDDARVERDSGPWLALWGPLSIAIVIAAVALVAKLSF